MPIRQWKNVGALLPAFNEERNIQAVIREVKSTLPSATIVVVDDGSRDRTAQLAKNEHVTVLQHKINRGKGEALKTGIAYFLKKFPSVKAIVVIDTDRQFSASDAPRLIKPLIEKKADIVMGMRDFSKTPFRHRLGNWVWRTAFNILFGTSLRDTNCGFIALSRKAMERANVQGGYIIENSILASAVRAGLRIGQVPITVYYKKISGVGRGVRVEAGVLWFILVEGLKYRLGL